jgi:hypothetical protein
VTSGAAQQRLGLLDVAARHGGEARTEQQEWRTAIVRGRGQRREPRPQGLPAPGGEAGRRGGEDEPGGLVEAPPGEGVADRRRLPGRLGEARRPPLEPGVPHRLLGAQRVQQVLPEEIAELVVDGVAPGECRGTADLALVMRVVLARPLVHPRDEERARVGGAQQPAYLGGRTTE